MHVQSLRLPRPRVRSRLLPGTRLVALLGAWLRHWTERRSLAVLDDRTLKDVGLTRADVEHEFARPFWLPVDHAALERTRRRSGPRLGGG